MTAIINGAIQDEFSGNISTDGYITGKKVGVFAALNASADTTVTTAGTYYPIAGTFTNDPFEDFGAATVHTPGIKYEGTLTQYFEIDWHATLSANGNNKTVICAVEKNGVVVTSSQMGKFCKTSGELYNASGTCVIELAEDDEIQLVVTSSGNGDIITFANYTTSITEFFD